MDRINDVLNEVSGSILDTVIAPKENAPDAVGNKGAEVVTQTDFTTSIAPCKEAATQIARMALAGHAVYKGQSGDYLVSKYGMTHYCQDFAELVEFARKLGVNHV